MTQQISNRLYIDAYSYDLSQSPEFSTDHELIIKLDEQRAMQECKEDIIFSTACWANYLSYWEIKDDKLFLNALDGVYKLLSDKPLFAGWFSGTISIGCGGLLENCFDELQRAQIRSFEIICGQVKSVSERDNDFMQRMMQDIELEPIADDDDFFG